MKEPINFIVVYSYKKVSYFLSNKNKVLDLSQSNLVREIPFPGCSSKHVGKTDHYLNKRLPKHSTRLKFSSVAHLHCKHAQHLVSLNQIFDHLPDMSSNIRNLVFNNFKIIYIKFNSPELNIGLKASKEHKLFPNSHCLFSTFNSHIPFPFYSIALPKSVYSYVN